MINTLAGKRVLLGVTAGIAAYKSAELVRRLREREARVRVVMTQGARSFVGPLTFQALSGNPVRCELLDPEAEAGMAHIDLARWADVVLVAPATADFIARAAHGLADDLLATVCLASAAPLVLAPSMNQQMWAAPATRDNCAVLLRRGVELLGPASGEQACGDRGPGRMLEPEAIVEALERRFAADGALRGVRVTVTAGPTREAIDPVRYISNRSSGRMGYAIARAAAEAGAAVTLVSGPVSLPAPPGVQCVQVTSAEQMAAAVRARLVHTDLFIAAAAVADYRPHTVAERKMKKTEAERELRLERTPDILAEVAGAAPRPFTVGFAAETEEVERNARAKLRAKGLDMIAANQVGVPGLGFDAADNELLVIWPGGERRLPRTDKEGLARQLVALVAERFAAQAQSGRTLSPEPCP